MRLKLLLIAVFLGSVVARADETEIHWAFPGVDEEIQKAFEEKSPYSPKGYIIEQIKAGLPEYKHKVFTANNKRVMNSLQETTNTCFLAGLHSADREKFTYMTSYAILPPIIVVMKKKTVATLPVANNKISLEYLLKQKSLNYSFTDQRVFGPQVDEVIRKVASSSSMVTADHMLGNNFIRMVGAGRISFTLEHPFFFEQYQKERADLKDLTFVVPTEEKDPLEIFIMCSKSPLGQKVIQKVDKLIRKLVTTAEYRKNVLTSYTEFDDDPEFKKQFQEYIRKRSLP